MTEQLFSTISPEARDIFAYWVETHKKRANTLLDNKREVRITWALGKYGAEDVRKAIKGCTYSSFHMGQNPARKRYNDLELILRDAPHVEQFLDLFELNVQGETDLEEWLNE